MSCTSEGFFKPDGVWLNGWCFKVNCVSFSVLKYTTKIGTCEGFFEPDGPAQPFFSQPAELTIVLEVMMMMMMARMMLLRLLIRRSESSLFLPECAKYPSRACTCPCWPDWQRISQRSHLPLISDDDWQHISERLYLSFFTEDDIDVDWQHTLVKARIC